MVTFRMIMIEHSSFKIMEPMMIFDFETSNRSAGVGNNLLAQVTVKGIGNMFVSEAGVCCEKVSHLPHRPRRGLSTPLASASTTPIGACIEAKVVRTWEESFNTFFEQDLPTPYYPQGCVFNKERFSVWR